MLVCKFAFKKKQKHIFTIYAKKTKATTTLWLMVMSQSADECQTPPQAAEFMTAAI